jgi:hypothetical protein
MKTKSIFLFILLIAGFIFLQSCDTKTSKVTFCDSVDSDLKEVNPGESFDHGSLWVKLLCKEDFNLNSVKVTLYKVDGASEKVIDTFEQTVSPEWNALAVPFSVADPGTYKVGFSTPDGKLLGSGKVTITKV